MATETVAVGNSLVFRDVDRTWRWFDAVGPEVRKWELGPAQVVSTTTAAGCTITQTNGTLVGADSTTGGAVVFTLGGADNDVIEVQSRSELFYFASAWPAYFGCKVQLVDADQQDVSIGFTIRDTDHAGGISDGIYLRLVDQSAIMSLVLEKNSTESTTAVLTAADATDYTLEMYYDGAGYIHVYVNAALIASVASSDVNWCNDEHLCATVANQAGEGTANNLTLYWARAIQVQAA
jgi:hypothetical protein